VSESACSALSQDEIEEAIRSLRDPDWIRLAKVARFYCRRRSHPDPDDLLQEAFTRAVDGSRKCPRNVGVVRFLAETMRSIASDTMKALGRHPELWTVPLVAENDTLSFDPPDCRPTAEQQIVGEEDVAQIKQVIVALFVDDPIAQILVEGIMEGMEGDELRALTELGKTAFASKRRLIRRRIEKVFPNGWKS